MPKSDKPKGFGEGKKNSQWKGGSKSTDALRARKAYEKHHGVKIPRGMIVHHKDGDPTNDSKSNLELVSRDEHNTIQKKGRTWEQIARAAKNKPNSDKQRRFRK